MQTIYTTQGNHKVDYGPSVSQKKSVILPAGLRCKPITKNSTGPSSLASLDGLYWLDEFPAQLFPAGSIERHDAEHYGIALPLGYLNYRFTGCPWNAEWIAHQPNSNGWQDRHLAAIARPTREERGIVSMLTGWIQYANDRHDGTRGVGSDGFLGPIWAETGLALCGLLNGPSGRLDCGTLSALVHGIIEAERNA